MKIISHDPGRFADLPDYPFAENWVDIDLGDGFSGRMHYVDEGPKDAPPVLLFHGEPSWSYLYRKMIPILVKQGFAALPPTSSVSVKATSPTTSAFTLTIGI